MPSADRPAHPSSSLDPALLGTLCAGFAALGYAAANTALRQVSDCDAVWVSAMKAVPSVMLVTPWLLARMIAGQSVVSSPRPMLLLAGAGILGQLGGNVAFQWALGVVGLAITVPLTLGTMIISGAVMQRWLLGEPVTRRSVVSMFVLVTAICVLSRGALTAQQAVSGGLGEVDGYWEVALGVAAACFPGVAYALMGVALRNAMQRGTPLPTALGTVTLCGVLVLGSLSLWRLGWTGISATPRSDLVVMLLAGVFNAVAFLSLTKALHLTSVVHVNALNASQVGMCSLIGVVLFHEPFTWPLGVGVGLTVLGLLLMRGRSKRRAAQPVAAISMPMDYTLMDLPAREREEAERAEPIVEQG